MHSFTRRGLRSRSFPEVTRQEINRFLGLSDDEQFEDLRLLRTRAAHLSGGSLSAFTALYISIIFFAVPLINASLPSDALWFPPTLIPAVFALALGLGIAYGFIHEQHNMARAAARLAFYEDVLSMSRDPSVNTNRAANR